MLPPVLLGRGVILAAAVWGGHICILGEVRIPDGIMHD